MGYKIIVDSCGDFTQEMKQSEIFQSVALEIQVDGVTVVDDESFEQAKFLEMVRKSENCPKSSCPSPESYRKAMEQQEGEHIYVVTLSEQLSGSYNSAQLGMQMYLEEHGDAKVHVFNSRSASAGETLAALEIQRLEEEGCSFEEVVERVEQFLEEHKTYFVLETLDTLRKNGRLTGIKAVLAKALNIKPIMEGTREGTIAQLDQCRGMEKAVSRMLEYVMEEGRASKRKWVAVSHCNCRERANRVRQKLSESGIFEKIFVMDTAGISTMYANDGGIVISV